MTKFNKDKSPTNARKRRKNKKKKPAVIRRQQKWITNKSNEMDQNKKWAKDKGARLKPGVRYANINKRNISPRCDKSTGWSMLNIFTNYFKNMISPNAYVDSKVQPVMKSKQLLEAQDCDLDEASVEDPHFKMKYKKKTRSVKPRKKKLITEKRKKKLKGGIKNGKEKCHLILNLETDTKRKVVNDIASKKFPFDTNKELVKTCVAKTKPPKPNQRRGFNPYATIMPEANPKFALKKKTAKKTATNISDVELPSKTIYEMKKNRVVKPSKKQLIIEERKKKLQHGDGSVKKKCKPLLKLATGSERNVIDNMAFEEFPDDTNEEAVKPCCAKMKHSKPNQKRKFSPYTAVVPVVKVKGPKKRKNAKTSAIESISEAALLKKVTRSGKFY